MIVSLIAVGSKMPSWVQQGYEEYAKRLPREFSLRLQEIPLAKRGKGVDIQAVIRKEGQRMLAAVPDRNRVIALDVGGQAWSTEQLAEQIEMWRMSGHNYSLLVGGPDGLSSQCLDRASQRWSLSALTLPHPLVRILLAEQLYRAWSISQHHPYHR